MTSLTISSTRLFIDKWPLSASFSAVSQSHFTHAMTSTFQQNKIHLILAQRVHWSPLRWKVRWKLLHAGLEKQAWDTSSTPVSSATCSTSVAYATNLTPGEIPVSDLEFTEIMNISEPSLPFSLIPIITLFQHTLEAIQSWFKLCDK